MIVREWELLNVMIYLLPQPNDCLMLDVQMPGNGGRLQCVLELAANANQYIVLNVLRNQMVQGLGDGLGHAAGCNI